MNKKGFSILVNVAYAVATVVVVLIIIMPILKSLFNSDKSTADFDNYQVLSQKIERLLVEENVKKTDSMFLDLREDFAIIAFDEDDIPTKICVGLKKGYLPGTREYRRPKQCEEKACICLFRPDFGVSGKGVEEDNPASLGDDTYLKFTYYEIDKIVVDCTIFEQKIRFYSFQEPWEMKSDCLATRKYSYPQDDFVKTLYNEITAGSDEEELEEIFFWNDHVIYGFQEDFKETLYLEVQQQGSVWHVLIGKADPYTNQARYKFANKCPNTKNDDPCKDKHFDEVVTVKTDKGEEQVQCLFSKEKNTCVQETRVIKCENEYIRGKTCDCGETVYSDGFCVDDKFLPDIEIGECTNITDCEDYGTLQNCVFSTCGWQNNLDCTWSNEYNQGFFKWFIKDGCKDCEKDCDCATYYAQDWIRNLDPCDCDGDGLKPDDVCFKCEQPASCEQYKEDARACEEDPCGAERSNIMTREQINCELSSKNICESKTIQL